MLGHNQPTYHPISRSVEKLEKNLAEVPNVTAWAALMNYSRNYFSRKFKQFFGEPPSDRLRQVRYQRVQKSIVNHPQETAYSVATRVGFKDDQQLYHFLYAHYDTNYTELRNELLSGNRRWKDKLV